MDRTIATRIWRDVSRGAPDGVPTSRTLHAFAQRVEESTIARLHAKHQPALIVGSELANFAFNLAQKAGHALTSDDVAMLDSLRRKWDESRNGPNVEVRRL